MYDRLDEAWVIVTRDMVPDVIENRYAISNYGDLKNIITGEYLYGKSLMSPDGRSLVVTRARLVYMAFINPIIPKGNKIIYLDGNEHNTYYKNLACVTHAEFKRIAFENNVIANSNLSDEEMSSRDYYRSNKKIMYYDTGEEWREITQLVVPNINPYYMISQYGRVYSKATNSIVKTGILNSGYVRIQLIGTDGNKIDLLLHRLVACVWVYNDDPINKTEVNHKDENTFNNKASNLEWITPLDNQLYSANITRNAYYKTEFTDDQVRDICVALQNNIPYNMICFNVLKCNYDGMMHKRIYRIHKRELHTDISKDYTF